MKRIAVVAGLSIVAACWPDGTSAQGSSANFSVERVLARCVVDNQRAYLSPRASPAMIFMRLCPRVELTVAEIAQENRAQELIAVRERQPSRVRYVVVLEPSQIPCFIRQLRAGLRRARNPLIEIDLGRCA